MDPASSPEKPRSKSNRVKFGGQPGRRALQDARATAALRAQPLPAGTDHVSWLQRILDQRMGELQVVQEVCETIQPDEFWRDTMSGKMPNEWIRLRNQYRAEAEQMLFKLVGAGIADRAVKVKEAQAVLLAQHVRAAAERAGLPPEMVRRLGHELRALSQGEGKAA